MSSIIVLPPSEEPDDATSRSPSTSDGPVLGAWYWVKSRPAKHWAEVDGITLVGHGGLIRGERLMCALEIGSNFVALRSPDSVGGGHDTVRIHMRDFWKLMRYEPQAMTILTSWARQQQLETARLMGEIQALTARLGIAPSQALPESQVPQPRNALMAMSAAPDVDAYKAALILAKDKQLPELYGHVKASNENLAALMHAQILPSLATVGDLKESVKDIEARIFSVQLYAGLHEDAVLVRDGTPAAAHERLHVMQARLYMDEECLANYRHGGMTFSHIGEFDKWLCEPDNLDRIFPFPRTLVAMRVRRMTKDRSYAHDLSAIARFRLEEADKKTFLYVRNGAQVWCIQTTMDFDESIFPDRAAFDPNEPKMAAVEHGRVQGFLGLSAWEGLCAEYDARMARADAWDQEIKTSGRTLEWHERNPHRGFGVEDPRKRYQPVDHTSVYFDDAMKVIEDQVQKYNRVAVIIQGLFDRSPILQPHPPVQTWTAEGFDRAIKLIYDGGETLHYGEAPDISGYIAQCNAKLGQGCLTIGQEDFWARREAEKETARRRRDWRLTESERYLEITHFEPYGNPGPGYIAPVVSWSKTRGATFQWERDRRTTPGPWDAPKSDKVSCSLSVPADRLFNVDAYQLGDFKKFFSDRRTRAQYLKWAPMLIAAEEHHYRLTKGS